MNSTHGRSTGRHRRDIWVSGSNHSSPRVRQSGRRILISVSNTTRNLKGSSPYDFVCKVEPLVGSESSLPLGLTGDHPLKDLDPLYPTLRLRCVSSRAIHNFSVHILIHPYFHFRKWLSLHPVSAAQAHPTLLEIALKEVDLMLHVYARRVRVRPFHRE